MQAHRLHVVVPEDRRATIEFPATIPSGPVELIVLVANGAEETPSAEAPQGRERIAALAAELAQQARPLGELTRDEREALLQRLRGLGEG